MQVTTGTRSRNKEHEESRPPPLQPSNQSALTTRPEAVDVGYMIAATQNNELRVGKVIASDASHVTVQLYRGLLNTQWEPIKNQNNDCIVTTVDIDNIPLDWVFALTKNNKLPGNMRIALNKYLV